MPDPRDFGGFLLAYFLGEDLAEGEQVYLALSDGDAPLHLRPLGDGPALRSDVGERGVRDPHLVRDPLTGGYHLLATDLRVHADQDWDRASDAGSRSVVVWDSPDLVHWDRPRLVELAPPGAGATWAPKAFWDDVSRDFLVVWSSAPTREGAFPGRQSGDHLRILSSRTRDFRQFSAPRVHLDPGWPVIDATFVLDGDRLHRFVKDERPRTAEHPDGKLVLHQVGDGYEDPAWQTVETGIAGRWLEHGEGPIAVPDPEGRGYLLFVDEFCRAGYRAYRSPDLAAGSWTPEPAAQLPAGARHGSILALSPAEHDRVLGAW